MQQLEALYWSEPKGLACDPGSDVAWPVDAPGGWVHQRGGWQPWVASGVLPLRHCHPLQWPCLPHPPTLPHTPLGAGYLYDPLNSYSFFNSSAGGIYGSRRNVTLQACALCPSK